jgi:hypothetical protein
MTTDKMAVALRVLHAISLKGKPDPADVVLLRAYCPDGRDLDPDELACMAIQEALKAQREQRERGQTA